MKKYTSILCLFVLLFAGSIQAQQSFTYTQYMNNLTPLAPAYSLLDQLPSASLITRKQWVGIEGAPKTTIFTGALPLPGVNASAGMFVCLDEVAVEKRTEVNFFFAKAAQLSARDYFAVSLNGGINTYKAAYSSLDPLDQSYRDDIRETSGVIGLSLMLYNPEKYYIGFSLPRASVRSFSPGSREGQRNWKNTWYVSGGYLQPLNETFMFKPALLVSYSKDQRTLVDASATFYWMEQLGAGINYRTSKEIAGMVSYTYQHRITIGYSYQLAGSAEVVSGMSDGSHELTLRYRFGKDPALKLL
jgi:type IX secretion system PorP/SprF family membrane protein